MSRQTIQPNPTRTYGRRIAQDEFLALQRQQGGGQGDTTTPIQLAGSAPYGMTAGGTLHLKMFTDGIWTEISRSVS